MRLPLKMLWVYAPMAVVATDTASHPTLAAILALAVAAVIVGEILLSISGSSDDRL